MMWFWGPGCAYAGVVLGGVGRGTGVVGIELHVERVLYSRGEVSEALEVGVPESTSDPEYSRDSSSVCGNIEHETIALAPLVAAASSSDNPARQTWLSHRCSSVKAVESEPTSVTVDRLEGFGFRITSEVMLSSTGSCAGGKEAEVVKLVMVGVWTTGRESIGLGV